MKKFARIFITISIVSLPIFSTAEEAEQETAAPSEPDSAFHLTGRYGEGELEAAGEVLLPTLANDDFVLFVNPRIVSGEGGRREFNGGLVFRSMQPDLKGIVGANLFYDYRVTESDAEFNQGGVGVEYLGKRFDLRANYYKPENTKERVNERDVTSNSTSSQTYTTWNDPYAEDHSIVQRGRTVSRTIESTTRQTFFQYESPLEGWDAEAGLLIPGLDKFADMRLFGGYYHFNGELGADDVAGAKVRFEVRVLPNVVVGAEWYEDNDLYGSDYFVNVRLSVPFSLGRDSRANSGSWLGGMDRGRELKDRMLEPVMRDWHVQSTTSEFQEDMAKRSVESTVTQESQRSFSQTLATDVLFVNKDTGDDANPGTSDQPLANVDTGIDNGERVFVMNTANGYDVNLDIKKDLDLMGQGFPIGNGGRFLNGDSRYTRLRPDNPNMPTIIVDGDSGAANVRIRGFDISGCQGNSLQTSPYAPVVIAIQNAPNVEIHNNRIHCALAGIVGQYEVMTQPYMLQVHDNQFDHLGLGAGIWASNSSGIFDFRDNTIDTTAIGAGALAMADGGGQTDLDLMMTGNSIGPGGLQTLGSLIINTNGVAGQLIDAIAGPLPTAVRDGIAGIPSDSLSILGLGAVGVSLDGSAVDVNAHIAGNDINDHLLGIAMIGYSEGVSFDSSVIENNHVQGGGTDTLLNYIHEEFVGTPYNWDQPFEFGLSGIAAVGINGATMNNLAIRDNVVRDQLLGITVAGIQGTRMNNIEISGNDVRNSMVGVLAVNEGADAQMNNLSINGNYIQGGGLGQLADVIGAHLPDGALPAWGDEVLSTVSDLDYGVAGILVDANLIAGSSGNEMNGLSIVDNRVRDNLAGVLVGGRNAEMRNGSISGNAIADSLVASAVLAIDSDLSGLQISNNSIDSVLAGIALIASGSNLDNMMISGNEITDSMVGVIFGLLNGTSANNAVIANNVISGGMDPNQLKLLKILVEQTGLTGNLEDLLGMDESGLSFPEDLSATGGSAGFVGLIDSADAISLDIHDNQVLLNQMGLFLQSNGNFPDTQISLMNNISSGPYLFTGSELDVSHAGNVPAVIIQP